MLGRDMNTRERLKGLPLSVTGESRARHFTLRPAVNSLETSSLTIDTHIFCFFMNETGFEPALGGFRGAD